ncbi:type IV toxin-antitoxin system AbiEi family antitoxin domain-containing protein [Gracilimonas sp. BCB1]|uniref:type IV toxin-antitoxin system AbiEi family antitoxin domain-containing protein n=1 Tax=Gracilimonas sp. BCB1 TaxID=3152362 RepID=UPI0032D932B4
MSDTHYEYLDAYLDEMRSRGRFTFTSNEVIEKFHLTENAFKKTIQRLLQKNRVARLRNEFYLIIPPEYASRQTLPLGYFIDDLMKFLERDYYVGLLTAAMYHGAAHQQPQTQFVISEPPYLRPIKNRQQSIVFCLKKGWNADFVTQQKTDAGYINFSSPALTALDLVSYSDRIGGITRATTVLAELVIELESDTLAKTAEDFPQTTTLQRLGYLFDEVLQETTLADDIYSVLDNRNYYPALLNPKTDSENQKAPNRWKIIPNMTVEVDEL